MSVFATEKSLESYNPSQIPWAYYSNITMKLCVCFSIILQKSTLLPKILKFFFYFLFALEAVKAHDSLFSVTSAEGQLSSVKSENKKASQSRKRKIVCSGIYCSSQWDNNTTTMSYELMISRIYNYGKIRCPNFFYCYDGY